MKSARWLAVVTVLALAACSTDHPPTLVVPAAPAQTSAAATPATRVLDLGLATTRIPIGWSTAPYKGEVATVYFPMLYVSSTPLVGPCLSERRTPLICTKNNWFPPRMQTPADGVVMLWSSTQFPASPFTNDQLKFARGTRTSVGGRPAKVYDGNQTRSCPPGAATEIDAHVLAYGEESPGESLVLVGCLGPKASATDHRAVHAMLSSLHIKAPWTPSRTRALRLAGLVTTRVPPRWSQTAFRGLTPPAGEAPVTFLGTKRFTGRCAAPILHPDVCGTRFPPGMRTPADGVTVMWAKVQQPGVGLTKRGYLTTIANRPARLYGSVTPTGCPPGAANVIEARILIRPEDLNDRIDMIACFGPKSTQTDRSDVYTMLADLKITG